MGSSLTATHPASVKCWTAVIVLNVRSRVIGAVVDSVSDVIALGADDIKPAEGGSRRHNSHSSRVKCVGCTRACYTPKSPDRAEPVSYGNRCRPLDERRLWQSRGARGLLCSVCHAQALRNCIRCCRRNRHRTVRNPISQFPAVSRGSVTANTVPAPSERASISPPCARAMDLAM